MEARNRPIVKDDAKLERFMDQARERSGTPEQIVEAMRPYVDVGMSHLNVRFPDAAYDTSGIELFPARSSERCDFTPAILKG